MSTVFIETKIENPELDWECSNLVISYMISDTIYTISYDLLFTDNTSGNIKSISILKFNGIEMHTISTTIVSTPFSVIYMNGLTKTEPGVDVTCSIIDLDIEIKYDYKEDPKYTMYYENYWYNYVDNFNKPVIICIALIK